MPSPLNYSRRFTNNFYSYLLFQFSSVQFSRSVVSNSLRPHELQPSKLLCPRNFPGNNTGVGCHFLLQCMKVKSESEVAQLRPTLSDLMDCSLPGSSFHGIFQAIILEWGAIAFSSCIVSCVYDIMGQNVNLYLSLPFLIT